jgi:hypothetical protein
MQSFHDSLFANEELIAKRGARQGLSTNFWIFFGFFLSDENGGGKQSRF